ncbi:hypothetical protein FRB97_000514 [Tulasnella sp. 331]|nr:hypothetical protein FRB97_000514 [Tulasnella sp. 331]
MTATSTVPNGTPPSRVPPKTLTSLPAILTSLSEIEALETSLSASLATLLASQQPIIEPLTRLQSLVPQIEELAADADLLSQKVGGTAKTAQRVGGRVRALDEEIRRVRDAAERVAAVTELKTSLVDLHSSIASEDWEAATRHCARAMAVPPEIMSGAFAESVVPSSDLPLPPAETLVQARESLLETFRTNFAAASSARDSANTSRFFKLFPAIGWENEGLEAYSDFVVDLVRARATVSGKTSSPVYYITTLTSLFESIALIVDQHQPVVEKYYGPGKMLIVVKRVLQECDRVVSGLIENWEEERQMQRKIQDTANPYFVALAPGTAAAQRRGGGSMMADDEGPDPREIDKVLNELAGMAGRWSAFRKFLCERLSDEESDEEGSATQVDVAGAVSNDTKDMVKDTPRAGTASSRPEVEIVESSGCHRLIEQLLETYYSPLEVWYLRSVMDKAHRVSSQEALDTPQTTTPDDVFYILKVVLNRLLSSGSFKCVERTGTHIRQIVERDLATVIRRKMEDIYSPQGQAGRAAGGSAAQKEKAERDNRNAFIVQLNDLDICSGHMDTLVKTVLASNQIPQIYQEDEILQVDEEVSSLLKLIPKFQTILKWGTEQLFNQLARPRLRSLVVDVYKDVSYVLEDDSFAAAEYQDIVRKRFVRAWEGLVDGFKDTFTEGNYRAFFSQAVEVLVRPWEKHILSMRFTEACDHLAPHDTPSLRLGAIRFDRDLRSVTTYLSTQTAFSDAREKFTRLQQISTILNLDLLLEPQIAPWFSNVPSTLETMARTARFQHAAVANEARFYKAKCFQQRATLEQRKVQIVTLNANQQRGGSSLCSFTEASPRRDIMTPLTVRRLSLPVGQPQPVFQRPQSVLQPAPQKAVPNLTQFAYESAPTADERQYKQQEMGSYQQYEHPNRYTEAIPQYKQKISPARSTRSQKMMPPPALPLTSFGNRAQFRPSPAKASGQNNWVDCPQQSILCEQQQQRNPRASDPIRTPFNPMRDIQMALRSNTAPPRKVTDAIVQQTPSLSRMRPFRPSSTAHGAHLSIGRNAPRGASIGVQQMDQRVASPAPKSGGGQEPKEAYGR